MKKRTRKQVAEISEPERPMPIGTPFKKGESGNPGGRSKSEREVVEAARGHGVAVIDRMAQMFFEDGNLHAGEVLLDRAYGRAKQKVEISGEDGGPVRVAAVREQLAARLVKLLGPGEDPA